ncbi:lecithin retinol acyltransferase family protein [Vibrio furnissii]|uniref:lecithin retinol acyltransferase family protein n=1 Tax=Vibrio furnissii TaxID=29494 RepID=UPI0025737E92|nr:lecithin retinol acyltransferase family protein [Vibrio furnissii]WJG20713.1 lecithin retinol acyltransferase family protein [Vibrio furnissii]
MASEPVIGSHLITPRSVYTHHGIYVGNGIVVHYSGLADGLDSGPVEEADLETFSAGKGFIVKTYKNAFSPDVVVDRARSRVGESSYNVFNNNCEHFCHWCILGDHTSPQVDQTTWVSAPSVGTIVGLAARGAVAASGSVVGVSGAGVMSGLASAGALVGGGAVAGVAVLGAVPGAAMASLMNSTVLADNPALEEDERDSRSIGRAASYAGVGAGTVGSIAAVSAAGTTAGLSAAGITSGLAAIGGTVGGGMAAGVVVATAAPVAAAAAVGYGVYKLVRWIKE